MSLISFDIIYKKKLDIDVFKLAPDSEFHQLKLMISGKYRIYNIASLYIIYKTQPLIYNDTTKLRDIFKSQKKVKLELSTDKPVQPLSSNNKASSSLTSSSIKHLCKCKAQYATYICDKCDEFVCESCVKKKKHITHINKLIKLNEYMSYIKTQYKDIASTIDDKIINDDSYQFLPYWSFDLNNEIENINKVYEYLKNVLEDMKELQIEYVMNVGNYAKYEGLKRDVDGIIREFSTVNISDECEKMLSEKKRICKLADSIMSGYNELKSELIVYANVIKDVQTFNEVMMKDMKEKFSYTKKKFYMFNTAITQCGGGGNSNNNNHKDSLNKSLNDFSNVPTSYKRSVNNTNVNSSLDNIKPTTTHNQETLLFKLKDPRHILIFSITSQSFKERTFIDANSTFKSNLTTHTDITQLNVPNNTLYLLSGKSYNKLFIYEYSQNTITFVTNVPNSHYYGNMVYIPLSNAIYFIGGNNQIKNDKYCISSSSFTALPNLNEKRQEFASMQFNNYVYVFFGFSPDKGRNLSSIERIDIDKEDKFEVVYINEQITLSGIACARCVEDDDSESEEVLILGGFDGKDYVDTTLLFNAKDIRVKDCDVVIPNMRKNGRFLFQRESMFVKVGKDVIGGFDMNNNVHLITKESYELFSEVQG